MRWEFSLAVGAAVAACALCAPAAAQVVDQPGGDVQWERRVPLAPSVRAAKAVAAGSPDAVYSNLGTFRNQSYAAGGATQQLLNTITRLAADDLNLVGTQPYSINGFRFTVTNLDTVDISARPLVRFYLPNGPGGGPGTLIESRTYNPTTFTAGVVGTIRTSSTFVLRSSAIWAGIAFDNNGGATGATAAQLDNLAQGIFSPAEVGTSADQYFVTDAAGSFDSSNPVGTLANFGGAPPADFGWEILTAQDVDLSITKTDGVDTAFPGGSVTYTITANNAGPDTVFDARVVDDFPATLTCTWTCAGSAGNTCAASGTGDINDATVDLGVGGSVTYTATCDVSPAATGTVVNTAAIFAPGTAVEANVLDNSATDTDAIGTSADLTITKTDGVTTVLPGGSVTYTIAVRNDGPGDVTGATVADTFPASLTCTWTCISAVFGSCTGSGNGNIADTVNLLAGDIATYTATCTISDSATGTLSNTATVTAAASVGDPTPGNNSATDSDTVGQAADLAITKTDGVTTASPGGTVTYTITASNAGPSGATGARVTDAFPDSLACTWTCVGAGGGTCAAAGSGSIDRLANLPVGGSVTYTASCAISGAATGTLSNTATVTALGSVTDPTPGNNSATDSDTLTASANLAITKTDGAATAAPGGDVTYTITASNAGPSNATGATVTDTFPAPLTCTWTCAGAGGGTCTAAGSGNISDSVSLPTAGSVSYTASCAVSVSATGTLSNTATVSAPAGTTDPTPGNNSATDVDILSAVPAASVSGTKTAAGSFEPGGTVTYTITLDNGGTGAQGDNAGDEFTDVLPATLTLVSATASSGIALATVGTNTVTWNGAIAAGAGVTITITATVSATVAPGTTVGNQGTLATDLDGDGSNETTRTTDNPATGAANDPTVFSVAGSVIAVPTSIPTLGFLGLALLALLLVGVGSARRRRPI